MGCSPNQMVQVADHVFISNAAGYVPDWNSGWVEVVGNRLTLTVTVHNAASITTAVFYAEGSYDGKVWKSIFNFSQLVFGVNSNGQSSIDYKFVRLRVGGVTGTNAMFEFSGTFTQASF